MSLVITKVLARSTDIKYKSISKKIVSSYGHIGLEIRTCFGQKTY